MIKIIAKITQFYNIQATSKKSHPPAAIGSKLSQQNRRQRGPEVLKSSNWQHMVTQVKDSGEAIQWGLSYAIHVERMGTL